MKRNLYLNREAKPPAPRDIRSAIKLARRMPGAISRAVLVGTVAKRWHVFSEWGAEPGTRGLSRLTHVYLARTVGVGDAYAYRPVEVADPVTYVSHGTVRLAYVCSSSVGTMPGLCIVRDRT